MNQPFKTISSFTQINITNLKTLVICDIDETVVTFSNGIDFCRKLADEMNDEFEQIFRMYKNIKNPVQTDPTGFNELLNKIKVNQGQLIFLTARNESATKKTKSDLDGSGLDYEAQPVHYTNNLISKGEYIKSNIKLDDYEKVIFIDDYTSYIQTVIDLNPQIECYLFKKNCFIN
jgi:hypothetical protein